MARGCQLTAAHVLFGQGAYTEPLLQRCESALEIVYQHNRWKRLANSADRKQHRTTHDDLMVATQHPGKLEECTCHLAGAGIGGGTPQ
mmetsp:Transcript_54820/g.122621  ORF Transcript_54820/g.122621 Transcript_54820/m.122621 type:complete len:88 (+) Transcript_54820:424-687(+)